MINHAFATERRRCERAIAALASVSQWSGTQLLWHSRQVDRYFNDLQTLKQRTGKPNQRGTRRLRDCLLTGYSGALCGFLQEAYARGLKHIKPLSPKRLEQLVRSTDPTKRIFDYAVVRAQKKANGTKRIILSPGHKIRRAQRLVGDILEASNVANQFDYNRTGKGPNAAIAEIIRLVEADGIRDFVIFDLENYFTSVDAKHLKGIPLPKKVMKHSVYFNRNAILVHNDAAEAETARHGLPQGARVSGILASTLLGRELCRIDGAMGIVTYVDDGVIGACDPAGAKSLAEAIKMRFGNLTGGPLGFKKLDVHSIEQGFPFLGYYLRLDSTSEQPKVLARPSHEARNKLRRKIIEKLSAIAHKLSWDEAVDVAQSHTAGWCKAFAVWKPSAQELYEFEGVVEAYVDDFFGLKAKS